MVVKFFVMASLCWWITASTVYAFQVFVLLDNNILLEVEKTDLVEEIRHKIKTKLNMSYDNFLLMANGQILKAGSTVKDYNIQAHTTIFMMMTIDQSTKLETSDAKMKHSSLSISGSEPCRP